MTTIEQTTAGDQQFGLICFRVGDALFGVRLSEVIGVAEPGEITRVYHLPPFVEGVTNFRELVLAVISVDKLFGLPLKERPNPKLVVLSAVGIEVGLLVDDVVGTQNISESDIGELPPGHSELASAVFDGVVTLSSERAQRSSSVNVLDVAKETVLTVLNAERLLMSPPMVRLRGDT